MRDVMFFDKMLTPKVITFIYWLLLVGVVIASLGMIFAGPGGFFSNLIKGILALVLGAVGVRIWCELLIVMFKMNEALQDIRNK